MDKLEELKKKYKEIGKEIERLEKGNKRWKAKFYERYHCVNDGGDIVYYYERNDCIDNFKYKTRNYFKTEEEAQEHLEKINTYYDLMNLAEELNNGEEIDWENGEQDKYFIEYCHYDNILGTDGAVGFQQIGQIYCLNEDFLEIAKERIGEDRLIKLFKGIKDE